MEHLMQIWTIFKTEVVPVLITASTAILPIIYTILKAKLTGIKLENETLAQTIGENSKTLRENTKMRDELEGISEKNKQLQTEIKTIAEMIYTVFSNSNLSADKKSKLADLYSLVVNEDTEKIIDDLRKEVSVWQEAYKQMEESMNEKNNEVEEEILTKSTMVRS